MLVGDQLRTCFEPVCDQLRTSFEPASVMEFGFNEAKTQSTLKFVGVPQTNETISAEVHHIVATSGGHIAA